MGPWEHTGMSVFKETRQMWLDDVTDSVGQTFLAHAMQCAKCHDHKFDPVPTRDYYKMMAVFSTTQFTERNAPFLAEENQAGFKESTEWVNAKIAGYQKQQRKLQEKIDRVRAPGLLFPVTHFFRTGFNDGIPVPAEVPLTDYGGVVALFLQHLGQSEFFGIKSGGTEGVDDAVEFAPVMATGEKGVATRRANAGG